MKNPGKSIPAQIQRSPRQGGQYVTILNLILHRFDKVLFQPEQRYIFNEQQGGALYKRVFCVADWPAGVIDPIPVHGGDRLIIPLDTPRGGVVQGSPAPTLNPTTVAVQPGVGRTLVPYQPIYLGAAPYMLSFVQGDVLTITNTDGSHLASAPTVGTSVTQSALQYTIDDADAWEGHHIKLFVRQIPHNA